MSVALLKLPRWLKEHLFLNKLFANLSPQEIKNLQQKVRNQN